MSDKVTMRQPALANEGKNESINALLRITAPHEWIIGCGLALALICSIGWGVFGRVELNVTVEGVVVYPGARSPVATAVNGRITRIFAEPGQIVAGGAPIVAIIPAEADMQMRIASATEQLLDELIENSDPVDDSVLQTALANLRVQNVELTALRKAGSLVVAPEAGVVTSINVNIGDPVVSGTVVAEYRHAASGPVLAAVFLGAKQSAEIEPGLSARVRLLTGDQEHIELNGRVASVSDLGELPAWLRTSPIAASKAALDNFGRLATIELEDAEALQVDDLQNCTVEIILENLRPLALLSSASS